MSRLHSDELGRSTPPRPDTKRRDGALSAPASADEPARPALDRLVHQLRIPATEALADLEVVVVQDGPAEVGEFSEEGEVLDVGRDDHREVLGCVPVLAVLATGRLSDDVLDAADCALVVEQVCLAAVRLVQELALARAGARRDVHGKERVFVAEEVGHDLAGGLVDLGRKVQMPAVLEKRRVIARVEVRRRVLRGRVFGAVQSVVDTEDLVFGDGVVLRQAGCRNMPSLLDETGLSRQVFVKPREKSVRLWRELAKVSLGG
jgi:hypothetical protein